MNYPDDFINQIVCGNCLELVKHIPDGVVDSIITDPPYGLGKEIEGDESLEVFYKVLPELHRVLKPNSWFITFFSTKFLPRLFENNPFNYFWQIVLYSPEAAVQSPIGFTKYMSCFVFKKGNPKVSRLNKDIFVDMPSKMIEPDEGYIAHPTPKPKHFIRELLAMFSKEGDIVLDPFIRSGSTAVACVQMNRRFIGFEIDSNYCKLAVGRVEKFMKDKQAQLRFIK
jgi:site-specific DNA-methyltransferase (adenine-specific)